MIDVNTTELQVHATAYPATPLLVFKYFRHTNLTEFEHKYASCSFIQTACLALFHITLYICTLERNEYALKNDEHLYYRPLFGMPFYHTLYHSFMHEARMLNMDLQSRQNVGDVR